jgi:tetratricopeptide (TPR) repeat protein
MGVAALALVAVASATSAALIWREKEHTGQALAEADKQRLRTEADFRAAYWAIEDMLHGYDSKWTLRELSVVELRQWQTQVALTFLAGFCEDQDDERAVRLQKGVALVTVGRVYQFRGESEKALDAVRKGIAVFERLADDFPNEATYRREQVTALLILAEEFRQAGRHEAANATKHQAVRLLQETLRDHPTDSEAVGRLALILQVSDPQAAEELARKTVELAPEDPENWKTLGVAYYRSGQWSAATDSLQESLLRAEGKRNWAPNEALLYVAMAQWRCGRREEAVKAYQRATQNLEDLVIDRTLQLEAAALLGIQDLPIPRALEDTPGKH